MDAWQRGIAGDRPGRPDLDSVMARCGPRWSDLGHASCGCCNYLIAPELMAVFTGKACCRNTLALCSFEIFHEIDHDGHGFPMKQRPYLV
jgi:hypothetical protein